MLPVLTDTGYSIYGCHACITPKPQLVVTAPRHCHQQGLNNTTPKSPALSGRSYYCGLIM